MIDLQAIPWEIILGLAIFTLGAYIRLKTQTLYYEKAVIDRMVSNTRKELKSDIENLAKSNEKSIRQTFSAVRFLREWIF